MAMSPVNNQKNIKIYQKIDMESLGLKTKKTTINWYNKDTSNESSIVKYVLAQIILSNQNLKNEYIQIEKEYVKNSENWIVDYGQLPNQNQNVKSNFRMLYIGESDLFFGELVINLEYINEDNSHYKNINNFIKNTNLEIVSDLDEIYLKEKIIELNKDSIEESHMTIDNLKLSIYYDHAVVFGVNGFEGELTVIFKYNLTEGINISTVEARVDVYNSEREDVRTEIWKYKPVLGKNKFLLTYKNINFDNKGYVWHNVNNGRKIYNNNVTLGIKNATVSEIMQQSDAGIENWTKASGNIEIKWDDQTLIVKIEARASAYATAANASWARSAALTKIENLKFTK